VESPLEEKVVLITGASSGIGEAIALALSDAGAKVVVGARRVEKLEGIASKAAGEVMVLPLDVTDPQSSRDAVAATVERFGRLDVLINNAGVMLSGMIEGADMTEWTTMINTNLLGTMYATHAALPHLLESKGTVLQTSSTSGRMSSVGGGVYSATKFGVNAFSESLRKEVTERGVRVVVIEPGFVDTELSSHITDPRMRELAHSMKSTMRPLQALDVAAAVVYALSQPSHVSVSELLIRPTDQTT